jgi:hypothetical protein
MAQVSQVVGQLGIGDVRSIDPMLTWDLMYPEQSINTTESSLSSNSAPNQPLYPLPYPTVLTKLKFARFCTRVFNLKDIP